MKKIFHKKKGVSHEIKALIFVVLGIAMLLISLFFPDNCKFVNILQGIGTGFFTGVAILLVTGVKTSNIEYYNESIEYVRQYQSLISELYAIQIDIKDKKLIINEVEHSIIEISYVMFKIKSFFERYENDDKFGIIMSEDIKKSHEELRNKYYDRIVNVSNNYYENMYNIKSVFDEILSEVNEIHGYMLEDVLDSDMELLTEELILKYNRDISKINKSKL